MFLVSVTVPRVHHALDWRKRTSLEGGEMCVRACVRSRARSCLVGPAVVSFHFAKEGSKSPEMFPQPPAPPHFHFGPPLRSASVSRVCVVKFKCRVLLLPV